MHFEGWLILTATGSTAAIRAPNTKQCINDELTSKEVLATAYRENPAKKEHLIKRKEHLIKQKDCA